MDFDSFYAAHFDRVHRAMTLAFRDPSFAEEVTQEAFYRALRRWSSVSTMDHPDAWTMVVALNRGRDASRRRRRSPDDALLHAGVSPGTDEAQVDDRMAIVALLARVSHRQRQALVLRYIAQLTVPEIAVVMKCAEGTVKSTLHAAINNAGTAMRGSAHAPD